MPAWLNVARAQVGGAGWEGRSWGAAAPWNETFPRAPGGALLGEGPLLPGGPAGGRPPPGVFGRWGQGRGRGGWARGGAGVGVVRVGGGGGGGAPPGGFFNGMGGEGGFLGVEFAARGGGGGIVGRGGRPRRGGAVVKGGAAAGDAGVAERR